MFTYLYVFVYILFLSLWIYLCIYACIYVYIPTYIYIPSLPLFSRSLFCKKLVPFCVVLCQLCVDTLCGVLVSKCTRSCLCWCSLVALICARHVPAPSILPPFACHFLRDYEGTVLPTIPFPAVFLPRCLPLPALRWIQIGKFRLGESGSDFAFMHPESGSTALEVYTSLDYSRQPFLLFEYQKF